MGARMSDRELHVEVDEGLCIGAGNCVRLARGTFALSEDRVAFVVDQSASDVSSLERAVHSCPAGAIRLAPRPSSRPPDALA
jgi:ferredoxin